MATPVLLMHESSLRHDPGPHPERAARIVAIERELEARGGLGWARRSPPPADMEALLAVHPESHVRFIRELCAAGGGMIDADTSVSPDSYEAALHSAGGVVEAARLVLDGEAPCAMSAHRPPGHHAEPERAMGFCLFANVACAARWAIDSGHAERVMILDWDVHHGNGTEAVFRESDDVLFVSIHEWPLYPGTGPASDVGSGDGEGFTVNLPVPAGSGDAAWVSLVAHVAAPLARAFEPGLALVSAGYDAHAEDPLAGCRVSDAGFAAMAAAVRMFAADVGAPVAIGLEGGYAVDALARGVCETLMMFGVEQPPEPPGLPKHELSVRALERLAAGPWGALV